MFRLKNKYSLVHIPLLGKPLSTNLKIALTELKGWLENETNTVLTPVHTKAERFLGETREAHKELIESCKMLLENSRKEIDKRNMRTFGRARALNKLAKLFLDRLQPVKVPEKPSYDGIKAFIEEAQKAFTVTDIDVRNWFPRISPFFIMDRGKFIKAFENAKSTLKELNEFLTKEYVKTKALEETFQLIEEVKKLKEHLATLTEEQKKTENEKAKIEEETAETRRKIDALKDGGALNQLTEITSETENLRKELEHALRHVQKPFIKLQSLATHGEGSGLTPEELKMLNKYLTDPFEAMATESSGYPVLKQILQKTARLISEGKLKLKQEKERKAKQAIEEILAKDSLSSLHQKCVAAKLRINQLVASADLAETKAEITKLQEHVERLEKKLESLKAELDKEEKARAETIEKIRSCKNRIEKNILNFTDKKVEITDF